MNSSIDNNINNNNNTNCSCSTTSPSSTATSVLDGILHDRLIRLHQNKSHDELLNLLVQTELSVIAFQKEIENLKLQNIQLKQHFIDYKNSLVHNTQQQQQSSMSCQYKKQKGVYTLFPNESDCFLPNESFVKKELSICDDDKEEDYDINDELIQFTLTTNKQQRKANADEMLFTYLNEIKNMLKKFLQVNKVWNEEFTLTTKVKCEEMDLDANEIIMLDIRKCIEGLYKVTDRYKGLFVDYSNQVLIMVQRDIVERVLQRMEVLNGSYMRIKEIVV